VADYELKEEESPEEAFKGSVVRASENYWSEADLARKSRLEQNEENWDVFNLKQDYSHKIKGQSREFLPRQSLAVEQLTAFMQQSLADMGRWFSVAPAPGNKKPLLTGAEIEKLLGAQLKKVGFYLHLADAVKSAALGSLMITKVHSETQSRPVFVTEKTKAGTVQLRRKKSERFQLRLDLVRQRDYAPDPTGSKLYRAEQIEMDLHEVKRLAEAHPDVYDVEEVERLCAAGDVAAQEETEKARETGQNVTSSGYRKRVVLREFWGTLLDADGSVLTDAEGVPLENCVWTVANGRYLIRPPAPNPFWHGEDPYVVGALIRVPWSEWHRAFMDFATKLNKATNEIFNLLVDGGLMSVFGIKQIRTHWLSNPAQVSGGIAPGTTLQVNQSCPPNMKALERVDTGTLGNEGFNVFSLISGETDSATMSSRLQNGNFPDHAVKATEVVTANQSRDQLFTGIVKNVETEHVRPVLEKAWYVMAQNFKDWDWNEVAALLGERKAEDLKQIPAEEFFAQTVQGYDFEVFGLTETIKRVEDFRKLTTVLQSVGSNPLLMEEFQRKYSFSKLLEQIFRSLNYDSSRIEHDEDEKALQEAESGLAQSQGAPDQMSQVAAPDGQASAVPRAPASDELTG
jgi:hypothetical protein